MFWQYELTTTNINNLLERDDITLQEILEEEDVLQELRTENHKLVKFLMKDENLGQLVSMIVSEPDESIEMNKQFKHASLACELLTAEINQTEMLSDLLIDDNKRSDDFFGFGQFGNNDKIMSSTLDEMKGVDGLADDSGEGTEEIADGIKVEKPKSPTQEEESLDKEKEKENDIIINEKDEEKEDTKLNNSLSEDSSNCDTTNDSIKEGEKTDDQDGEKHIKKLFQFLDNNDVNPLLGGRVINWQEFFLMRLKIHHQNLNGSFNCCVGYDVTENSLHINYIDNS